MHISPRPGRTRRCLTVAATTVAAAGSALTLASPAEAATWRLTYGPVSGYAASVATAGVKTFFQTGALTPTTGTIRLTVRCAPVGRGSTSIQKVNLVNAAGRLTSVRTSAITCNNTTKTISVPVTRGARTSVRFTVRGAKTKVTAAVYELR